MSNSGTYRKIKNMTTTMLTSGLQHITLNGAWQIDGYKDLQLSGTVPGCIHTDLIDHDLIPDIHFRDNETQMHWVYEQDWTYSRTFELSDEQTHAQTLTLRCHGLDTLASVYVNDKKLAQCNADNN